MRRSSTATFYCDHYGNPYHCTNTDGVPKKLDNQNIHNDIFTQWARRLIPIGPLPAITPQNAPSLISYLCSRRYDALQVSASEFLNFFLREAEQHAQQTWDNGELGALWKFDEAGMRIHLYDLTAENNHKIGAYLLNGRQEGCITHVEYTPNQQPVFYIDGQEVR